MAGSRYDLCRAVPVAAVAIPAVALAERVKVASVRSRILNLLDSPERLKKSHDASP